LLFLNRFVAWIGVAPGKCVKKPRNFIFGIKCVYLFKIGCMRTNIDIDDDLMAKARKLSNIKTKKALVEEALRLYVTIENQKKLIDLWGTIEVDEKAYE
jgi:Arc/MetJ family transcription regulator